MYSRARSKALRSASEALGSASGTVESTPVTMPGDVPQETVGVMSAALRVSSRSKVAPGSVARERQWVTASCQRNSSATEAKDEMRGSLHSGFASGRDDGARRGGGAWLI